MQEARASPGIQSKERCGAYFANGFILPTEKGEIEEEPIHTKQASYLGPSTCTGMAQPHHHGSLSEHFCRALEWNTISLGVPTARPPNVVKDLQVNESHVRGSLLLVCTAHTVSIENKGNG